MDDGLCCKKTDIVFFTSFNSEGCLKIYISKNFCFVFPLSFTGHHKVMDSIERALDLQFHTVKVLKNLFVVFSQVKFDWINSNQLCQYENHGILC